MKQSRKPLELPMPALDEARLERQWVAVREGLGSAPRQRHMHRALGWGGVALALSAALVAGYRGAFVTVPAQQAQQGAVLGGAREPVQLSLDDGSTVELEARAELRVERVGDTQVELALLGGSANFDVTPNRARRFRVVADAVHIDVIGTKFRVTREHTDQGLRVQVSVERGVVEVGRSDRSAERRRLLAGESWSVSVGPLHEGVAATQQADSEPALAPPPDEADVVPEAPTQSAQPRPTAPPTEADEPSALFAEATLARRAGRVAEAVHGYAQLLALHPQDGRAGLAAFELGRLRMDALGDPRGAAEALRAALGAPGGEAFREDAMARLVMAYDALNETVACRRAREHYLSRYPHGVHVAALSVRCAEQ